jgi:cell division protein FtsZ
MGGAALMAVGRASGEDRARKAAEQALASRLLDVTIDGARGILFNVTGGNDLSLYEINEAAAMIRETAHPDVNLIFGAVIDESMQDEIRMTVIATGFEHASPMTRHMSRPSERRPVRESRAASPGSNSGRRQEETRTPARQPRREEAPFRVNDLDIPAFLRKRR